MTRDKLARELERLKAHWPSMPVSGIAFDNFASELAGYDDMEMHAAVSLLLHEYDAAANPKPKHVGDYCARIAKVRRREVAQALTATEDDAFCPMCGTRDMDEVPHPGWDSEHWPPPKVAWWRKWLGAFWPVQERVVYLASRIHPRCHDTCPRPLFPPQPGAVPFVRHRGRHG